MTFVYLLVWWSLDEWNPNGGGIKTEVYSNQHACAQAKGYIISKCLREDRLCVVECLKKPVRETP